MRCTLSVLNCHFMYTVYCCSLWYCTQCILWKVLERNEKAWESAFWNIFHKSDRSTSPIRLGGLAATDRWDRGALPGVPPRSEMESEVEVGPPHGTCWPPWAGPSVPTGRPLRTLPPTPEISGDPDRNNFCDNLRFSILRGLDFISTCFLYCREINIVWILCYYMGIEKTSIWFCRVVWIVWLDFFMFSIGV